MMRTGERGARDDSSSGRVARNALSRRRLLRVALGTTGLVLLGACAPAPTPTSAPTAAAPTAAATAAPKAAATTAPTAAAATPTAQVQPAPKAEPTQAPTSEVSVSVGVVGAQSFSPLTVGNDLGKFAEDKVTVEVVEHRGGAEAAQALVGGGINLFQGDFSHALRLNQQGQKIIVVGGATERHAYTLVGQQDGSADVSWLKGRKVGITSPGSQTDTSMRWLLKTNNLNPDTDVELVAIGGGPPMLAAIQNQQVDAGTVVEPFTSQLRHENYAVVYDFWEETAPYQGTVFMARQDWLQENGEAVRRFLAAFYNVVKLLHEDVETRNKLAREAYPQLDPEVVDMAAERMVQSYSVDGKVKDESVERVFEFERIAMDREGETLPLSEFSDFSYLP